MFKSRQRKKVEEKHLEAAWQRHVIPTRSVCSKENRPVAWDKRKLRPGEQQGGLGAQMRVLLVQGARGDGLETYFGGRANWSTQAPSFPLGLLGSHLPQPPLTFLLTRKLAATASPCVKLSMVLASRLR